MCSELMKTTDLSSSRSHYNANMALMVVLMQLETGPPLDEVSIACVLRERLLSLYYLHSEGEIHGDSKAANILLTANGDVKVADFGVSAQLTRTMSKRKVISIRFAASLYTISISFVLPIALALFYLYVYTQTFLQLGNMTTLLQFSCFRFCYSRMDYTKIAGKVNLMCFWQWNLYL